MKLALRNIGRIEEAELDLRPLTVFVGKNNVNKSWAAYGAYFGFRAQSFRTLEESFNHDGLLPVWLQAHRRDLLAQARGLTEGATAALVVTQTSPPGASEASVTEAIEAIAGAGAESTVRFSASEAKLVVRRLELRITLQNEMFRVHGAFDVGRRPPQPVSIVVGGFETLEWVVESLLRALSATVHGTYFFPTERALLVHDVFHERSLETLAAPVADCARWLDEARLRASAATPARGDVEALRLLHEALGGGVRVDPNRNVAFVGDGFSLPVQHSASMARSLAPLSLYLQTLAHRGDVLVIDEPELNAHPEAQLRILELFATMVNRGYRILFTTHSPYILDHLDTLMEGARLTKARRNRVGPKLPLGTADAFLDPKHVAAFEFREADDGSVEIADILDRKARHIASSTFGSVTDRLGDLMNAVLDEAG